MRKYKSRVGVMTMLPGLSECISPVFLYVLHSELNNSSKIYTCLNLCIAASTIWQNFAEIVIYIPFLECKLLDFYLDFLKVCF